MGKKRTREAETAEKATKLDAKGKDLDSSDEEVQLDPPLQAGRTLL